MKMMGLLKVYGFISLSEQNARSQTLLISGLNTLRFKTLLKIAILPGPTLPLSIIPFLLKNNPQQGHISENKRSTLTNQSISRTPLLLTVFLLITAESSYGLDWCKIQ